MKNIISISLALLLAGILNAQDLTYVKKKQLKANVSFLGLDINYENRITKHSTINFEAGFNFGFSYSKSIFFGNNFSYIVSPTFSAEYRNYYNILKRIKNNKTTINNSGNFWSFTTGFKTRSIIAQNTYDSPVLYLVPAWGIQRSWGKHFNAEARFGVAIKYATVGANWSGSPNVRISIGYIIK